MDKRISVKEAIAKIGDGATVMVGGFNACGHPDLLVQTLLDNSTAKDLTLISCDTGTDALSSGKLVASGRVKKIYSTYIGHNTATCRMLMEDEESVVLVPQGTFVERIRIAGAGIGGFLTKVGMGTIAAKGKQIVEVSGEQYLLELPLAADFALVWANVADLYGNMRVLGTAKNFNTIMPAAAKVTIAVAEQVVEAIEPEEITVPGLFVQHVVDGGDRSE